MINLQRKAEASYIEAKRQLTAQTKQRKLLTTLAHLTALSDQTYKKEYFYFLDEIFLPLGGWHKLSHTLSDTAYRQAIQKQWTQKMRFVALIADHHLRSSVSGPVNNASIGRAADFLAMHGYGETNAKNPSDSRTLWRRHKVRSGLLYALWKADPESYLLYSYTRLGSPEAQKELLRRARSILYLADQATERLVKMPNVVLHTNAAAFFRTRVTLPLGAVGEGLCLEPFSKEERKLMKGYIPNGRRKPDKAKV
jgi:hypothetical protein